MRHAGSFRQCGGLIRLIMKARLGKYTCNSLLSSYIPRRSGPTPSPPRRRDRYLSSAKNKELLEVGSSAARRDLLPGKRCWSRDPSRGRSSSSGHVPATQKRTEIKATQTRSMSDIYNEDGEIPRSQSRIFLDFSYFLEGIARPPLPT